MKILSFCSALNNSYLALEKEGRVFSKVIKSDENYHSLYLPFEIKKMLKENDVKFDELDFIAVNLGIGSFTGIRAALTIAKVMACELNIPLVGLNSTEILLREYCADIFLSDARRDMYFVGNKDNTKLYPKEEVEQDIKSSHPKIVLGSKIVCDKRCKEAIFDIAENYEIICYEEDDRNLSSTMLNLAKEKYSTSQDKEEFNPIKVQANYIQTPPIFN